MTPASQPASVPVTVIVPCFNEEAMIAECLESVRFAEEILVVDSFSTDRTVAIAHQYTERLIQHEFWSHGAQNNWAMVQARHPWVLVVDADERVTPQLAGEIAQLLRNPEADGYWIRRRNFLLGKQIRYGVWANDWVLRLFRRDKGRYEEKPVHSRVELTGTPGRCRQELVHLSYRSLDDYMRKIHRFSKGGALWAFNHGARSGPGRMLSHSLGRFVKSYLLKRGFLDGTEGLIIAFMEAYGAFLKYAKLWELQRAQAKPSVTGADPESSRPSSETAPPK